MLLRASDSYENYKQVNVTDGVMTVNVTELLGSPEWELMSTDKQSLR